MFQLGGTVLIIITFSIILMGFIDLFIKEPNRCEMSYMYQPPEYVEIESRFLEKQFPNYHLYVYGEGSYVDTLRLHEFNGIPVLFVPGNGGSYKQVRSMGTVSPMWANRGYPHLNYFTIDYNEELSAFIGEKLEFQTKFLYHAFNKILQLYSKGRNINVILVGHSIGGILIKSLLTKSYFRKHLARVSAVFTLATPHSHPAISYDYKTLNFYKQVNSDFGQYRDNFFGDINFISIGGSFQDSIIRSDLILLNTQYQYDTSILTTAISDVWVSADHLCIVWCRQLMVKLDGLFVDLIDEDKNRFMNDPQDKQKVIDYHLKGRPLSSLEFPKHLTSNISEYSKIKANDSHQFVGFNLIRRKLVLNEQQQNYFIKLYPYETLIFYVQGIFTANTLAVGKCEVDSANLEFDCQNRIILLYNRMVLIPGGKHGRLGCFESDEFLQQNFTHLILHLNSGQKSNQEYRIMIDRFHNGVRRRNIELPSLFKSFFSKDFLEPQLIFSKLPTQPTMFYELSLEKNFDYIWNSFWTTLQTTTCQQQQQNKLSSNNEDFPFNGFVYLIFPDDRMNQYFWPIKPQKGRQLEFGLLRDHNDLDRWETDIVKPKMLIFLDPNCGYDILVKNSLSSSVAQLLRHYFALLIPMLISTIIILLCILFSNVCNRFTLTGIYSTNTTGTGTMAKSKNHFKSMNIQNQKCYQLMSASEVMINHHYFLFSFVMIVPNVLLSLFFIKSFYPHHDLVHLSNLPLEHRVSICSILFLFSYSIIFAFLVLVTHLANNFANGLLFFRIRTKKIVAPFGFLAGFLMNQSTNMVSILECGFVLLLISSLVYFTPLNYYLLHFFFTLIMLCRFVKAKSVELESGPTTSTTLIYSLYPIIFGLLMAMTLIHIPYCIDWIFEFSHPHPRHAYQWWSAAKMFSSTGLIRHCKSLVLLILMKIFMFYIYTTPINLKARLKTFELNGTQKMLNISYLVVSFSNMMFSILTIEFLQINIIITLMIVLGHLRIILNKINYNQDNKNNDNDNNVVVGGGGSSSNSIDVGESKSKSD